MKFLQGLTTETKAVQSQAIARAVSGSRTGQFGMYSPPSRWDVDKSLAEYERVLWAFRCVDAISQAQADTPVVVRRGDRMRGPIVSYPDVTRLLNQRANSYEDAWTFRYRLSGQLLLSIRGSFIEIVPSVSGGQSELHLLPPGQTTPIPDPETFVSGYNVQRLDGGIDFLPPERVIWVKLKPHPTDPYRQMTPLVAAGLSVETDYFAHLFNRNFMMNDGRPGMLVSIAGDISQEDAQELKRRFGGGYVTAGQTTVIQASEVTATDMSANPRDLQWSEMITGSKEEILLAFGTPESVLGNASGRTFDNADAEREIWWEDTVQPHCNSITRNLDVLTGNVNDADTIVHDYSGVDVLQRHENTRKTAKATEFSSGLCTLDDYLLESGEEVLNVPGSRVYYLPNGVVVASDPADAEAASKQPMVIPPVMMAQQTARAQSGLPQALGPGYTQAVLALPGSTGRLVDPPEHKGDPTGQPDGARTSEGPQTDPSDPPLVLYGDVMQAKTDTHLMNVWNEMEGYVEGALDIWTDRQTEVVVDRLDHVKARKGTRHWEGGAVNEAVEVKALNANYVLDMSKWGDDIHRMLSSRLNRMGEQEGKHVVKDAQANGVPNAEFNAAHLALVLAPIENIIKTASYNQQLRIIRKITQMDQDGASMTDIKKQVRAMMSQRGQWHKALANNVTGQLLNGVRDSVYSQGGDKLIKVWHAHHDERTRPTHSAADNQFVPQDSYFHVGDAMLRYPNDPLGPPSEVINCRCHLSYHPNPKALVP